MTLYVIITDYVFIFAFIDYESIDKVIIMLQRDEVLPCIQLGGIEEMIVSKKKKSKKQKPVCASNSSISSSSMASSYVFIYLILRSVFYFTEIQRR